MTILLCIYTSPALAKLAQSNPSFVAISTKLSNSALQQGKALYDAGRFTEAVKVLQQAAEAYQRQGDTNKLAATLSNLSLAYQQLGAWKEAESAIAQSLNILGYQKVENRTQKYTSSTAEQKNLPNPQILPQTLDIKGRLQLTIGQPEEALKTWQQSADIYTKLSDRNGVVRSQINQAQALLSSGFYRRAETTLSALNQTLQSQPDSLEKLITLRSLGDVFQLVGNLSKSRIHLLQSLEIAKRLKSPDHIAASLFSLGNNARAQDQIQQAINYYQQTVKEATSLKVKVQAQLNYLSLLIEEGQSETALNLLPKIQSELEQLPLSRASIFARINFAESLAKLGNQEDKGTRGGHFRAEVPSVEESVRRQGGEGGEEVIRVNSSPSSSSSLSSPSVSPPLPASSSSASSPAQLLAQAVQQARSLDDKRAEAYALGSLGSLYEQTGQWQAAQNLTQQALLLAQASNASEIAYRWQWQLGRLLKAQGDLQGAIAAYDVAVETLQSLRSDLVAVNQDLRFNFRDSVEPVYRQSVQLLLQEQQKQPDEKTLEKARQIIEALQLAELDNFFRQACLQGQRVLLDQIVDKENPTAAILYPIILPEEIQVIVKIPKQPLQHHQIKISQAEVEKTVVQLRQNLINPAAIKAVRLQSQQVYNWLIKPIESKLSASGVNTLVFIPDGVLRNLPMSVLYDGRQYLVEKYAVALSVGLQLLDPKPLQPQQLKALTAGLTQPPPGYSNFSPLPAIKTEIEMINETGISTTDLLDRQFTSQALENKVNATSFNVVHLATHGQFSSRAEQTFILAADGPINVTEFDNIFRRRDETTSTPVQLLVLSACQTAAGDKRAALGLAGAAVRAGARSTVASLWQIDDDSTAQFIGAFYRQLKNVGITKVEALRRAQLQLLQHPNYNAPGFWSAYVLIGNWL
ncbi:CHAT domain-containing protein [Chlorogloeopsis sp. ULAP01]|uniref:CHAT domain-containing protein n=1 Tax=Chlorogloeopsis sp. ULAP01 TaxID=3056483 RepID=UPI0025AA67F5|nr:CHAT domain-containing protein [Chlorogloeopsis sp. ULAP01]MDM9385502.1 CHAT domain-containing protein [Chlorogloeopsis sp. ULAP01]